MFVIYNRTVVTFNALCVYYFFSGYEHDQFISFNFKFSLNQFKLYDNNVILIK